MNEKVKQIFDILGVEPEEEFKFRNNNPVIYKFDNDMNLLFKLSKGWELSDLDFSYVVKTKIEKISQKLKLTNKDKIAIKFLKNCGCHYIARDQDRLLCAYKDKPYKQNDRWDTHGLDSMPLFGGGGEKIFDLKISWTDAEPLCLDDFTDDDLKEN